MSKPHEKTGQTTEQGKQINSRNAAKLRQIFIDEAARALRELARADCEFDKSEQALYSQQPDKLEWDTAQQAEFERKLRNRSTAQRAYSRRLRAVEYLDKLQLQAQQRRAFTRTIAFTAAAAFTSAAKSTRRLATGQGIEPWMASVTFGGPDLQTLYIGSLKGKRIPSFRVSYSWSSHGPLVGDILVRS